MGLLSPIAGESINESETSNKAKFSRFNQCFSLGNRFKRQLNRAM
jgi:hypothetical protein